MTVALDLGTTSFRAVRVDRRRCRVRKLTAEYAVGDHNESTLAALRRLERGYLLTESKLVLVGETARLFAPMLNQTCRPIVAAIERPEPPHHDWVRRAALGQLLAPAATPDETCLLVAPRAWETSSTGAFEHLLTHLESFGYRPQRTSAGLAIVLAAGHRSGFTAVGLSFGAGSTEFSVVHRGRELAHRSCVWGGNWVDARCRELWRDLHGTDLEIGQIRRWKRSDRVVLSRAEHDLELTLRQSVRDALERALGEAASALAPSRACFPLRSICWRREVRRSNPVSRSR